MTKHLVGNNITVIEEAVKMEITIKVTSIEELRQMAAQVLAGHPGQQDTYQKVKGSEPVGTVDTPAEYKTEAPAKEEPKTEAPAKEEPKVKPVDIAVVRAELTEVHKSCAPDTVPGLLASFGVKKLTELDPGSYADIMAKAAVLLEKSNG
jgi:hypothetical protein